MEKFLRVIHRKEVKSMSKTLTSRYIDDGKRISSLFATLSEENKTMAIVYLSALRDKEIVDSAKKEFQYGCEKMAHLRKSKS